MPEVKLTKLVEKMNLKNLTPEIDLTEKVITVPDINRPALQLTGYFDHFDSERVQIIGYVEYTYLQTLTETGSVSGAALLWYSVSDFYDRDTSG